MSNVFFTSDLHFGHESLVEFRSGVHGYNFKDADEVDDWIVSQWNSVVHKRDIVWVLGDVAWNREGLSKFSRLNGQKKLVLGNHDKRASEEYLGYFLRLYGVVRKYGLVMSHVPIHPAEMAFRWKLNIHGHIHHKERLLDDSIYYCVNVDVQNGLPVDKDFILDKYSDLLGG